MNKFEEMATVSGCEDQHMVSFCYTRKVRIKREKHPREAKGRTNCEIDMRKSTI